MIGKIFVHGYNSKSPDSSCFRQMDYWGTGYIASRSKLKLDTVLRVNLFFYQLSLFRLLVGISFMTATGCFFRAWFMFRLNRGTVIRRHRRQSFSYTTTVVGIGLSEV